MKLLKIMLCLLVFSACKKGREEPQPPPEAYFPGKATATLNGELWNGLVSKLIPAGAGGTNFKITMRDDQVGGPFREFHFSNLALAAGRQNLSASELSSGGFFQPFATFFHSGGDVIYDIYNLIETDTIEDFVEITEIDTTNKIVKGNFQASFAIDTTWLSQGGSATGDVDTLVFRFGGFWTKFEE